MITFVVPGVPIAQPRQRHTRRGANYIPNDHPIHAFKQAVQNAAKSVWSGGPLAGAVGVAVVFVFPRPVGRIWKRRPMPSTRKVAKPDVDNLLKGLLDSLNGICWQDDAQVTDVVLQKREAAGGEPACVSVQIQELPIETGDCHAQ